MYRYQHFCAAEDIMDEIHRGEIVHDQRQEMILSALVHAILATTSNSTPTEASNFRFKQERAREKSEE